ncbi:MAG: hypothetical protein MJ241_01605 [Bacilli bacterium]|nr:hypothetical protein [Bacilli bacterium]
MKNKTFYTILLSILVIGVIASIVLLIITSRLLDNVSMITFIGKEIG